MHEDWEFLHDLLDISIYRHFRSNIEDSDSEGRSKPVLEVVQFFYSSALSPINRHRFLLVTYSSAAVWGFGMYPPAVSMTYSKQSTGKDCLGQWDGFIFTWSYKPLRTRFCHVFIVSTAFYKIKYTTF
jgi:hypothetical protein